MFTMQTSRYEFGSPAALWLGMVVIHLIPIIPGLEGGKHKDPRNGQRNRGSPASTEDGFSENELERWLLKGPSDYQSLASEYIYT